MCLKTTIFVLGGPPSKPKYISMTDSEQVPWGKGEKNPKKGSEKKTWNSMQTISRTMLLLFNKNQIVFV